MACRLYDVSFSPALLHLRNSQKTPAGFLDQVSAGKSIIIMPIREKVLSADSDFLTCQTRQSLQADINQALSQRSDISGKGKGRALS